MLRCRDLSGLESDAACDSLCNALHDTGEQHLLLSCSSGPVAGATATAAECAQPRRSFVRATSSGPMQVLNPTFSLCWRSALQQMMRMVFDGHICQKLLVLAGDVLRGDGQERQNPIITNSSPAVQRLRDGAVARQAAVLRLRAAAERYAAVAARAQHGPPVHLQEV